MIGIGSMPKIQRDPRFLFLELIYLINIVYLIQGDQAIGP